MRKDLDDLLCHRYPTIFRDRLGDKSETNMCWGFCCGEGWFEIIDELCATISSKVKAGAMPDVIASQVKEKTGTLRFYIRGGNEETRSLIELARNKSERTCEACGLPNEKRPEMPWQSLCPACTTKNN